MIRATARFSSAILPLAMAACSTTGDYPSLAPRDSQRVCGNVEPVAIEAPPPAPALPPASADLVTRLKGLVSAAQEADRQFRVQQDKAESAVASAARAAATSDPWSTAQIAIANLETSRGTAIAALAELDTLYADARDAAPVEVSPRTKAIAEARTRVAGIVAREDGVIDGLSARLRP